ncbi:hypothetical protein GCM10011491_30600 [Brucella endophytica]|uniref:Uncharacterized protein n=1 Tax=Brucella endophytica TaxID=1963359 RepID=A0A916SHD2_9HYPH|nr:hypothetical protein [Brucella endophytica]GGB00282.1 hypothetical protein GCM10011491_30600 [Brucella endophytica]
MTPRQQAKSITQSLENPLDRALVDYFEERLGKWIERRTAMRACGFDSPDDQPVGAYVQFQCSLLRANRALLPHGLRICQSQDGEQIYSMGRADGCR